MQSCGVSCDNAISHTRHDAYLRRPDSRAPAAPKGKSVIASHEHDIPGIGAGHTTQGLGRAVQIRYPLSHPTAAKPALCVTPCKTAVNSGKKRKHLASCEHSIIWEYRKANKLTQY